MYHGTSNSTTLQMYADRPHQNVHQFEQEYDGFDYDHEDNPESQNLYVGTVQVTSILTLQLNSE